MKAKGLLCLLLGALLLLGLGTAPAQAERKVLTEELLATEDVEDACGAAIAPSGDLYVSDYYHGLVKGFQIIDLSDGGAVPASTLPAGVSPEGPCQIAFDSKGTLYANLWHERVVRVNPSPRSFDLERSTGVAVDEEDNVYANDRTYVAVYEPSGEPLLSEGEPLRIGLGALKDAYGLACFQGRLYVADAATSTIEVFEPALDPDSPIASITGIDTPQGHFVSLVDAALTVDPTNGNVLVLDNLQPGYEHPQAVVDEFSKDGEFLDQLRAKVIDGGPSGMAVDSEGNLYLTSGNSEEANAFAFGPYVEVGGGEEVAEGEAAGSVAGQGASSSPEPSEHAAPEAGTPLGPPSPRADEKRPKRRLQRRLRRGATLRLRTPRNR
jgi:sugar lactone lactonase YvrE